MWRSRCCRLRWLLARSTWRGFSAKPKVLASLNHSNIATIYGREEADQTKALVMKLVEGPTRGASTVSQGPGNASQGMSLSMVFPR